LEPSEGWHCSHLYYRFQRRVLSKLSADRIGAGREELMAILDPQGSGAPARLQTGIVSGNKADFGLMMMDPNPLVIDAVNQRLMASALGPALTPTYSFISISEISEYVPSVQQYAQRLVQEGEVEGSPAYQAKVAAYEKREPMMRRQRLTPDFPRNDVRRQGDSVDHGGSRRGGLGMGRYLVGPKSLVAHRDRVPNAI
jgi:chlorite dismutase